MKGQRQVLGSLLSGLKGVPTGIGLLGLWVLMAGVAQGLPADRAVTRGDGPEDFGEGWQRREELIPKLREVRQDRRETIIPKLREVRQDRRESFLDRRQNYRGSFRPDFGGYRGEGGQFFRDQRRGGS